MVKLNLLMENIIKEFTEASIMKDVKATGVIEGQGFLIEFTGSKQVIDLLCVYHLNKNIIYFYNGFVEKALFLFPQYFNNIRGWIEMYKGEISKTVLFKNTVEREKLIDVSELLIKPKPKKKKRQNKTEEEDLDIRGLTDDIDGRYSFIIDDEDTSSSNNDNSFGFGIDFSSAKKLNSKSSIKIKPKKEKKVKEIIVQPEKKQEIIKPIVKENIVRKENIKPATKTIVVERRNDNIDVEQIKVILNMIVENSSLNIDNEIPERLQKYSVEIKKFQKLVTTMNTSSIDKVKFIQTVAGNIYKLLNKGARFNG